MTGIKSFLSQKKVKLALCSLVVTFILTLVLSIANTALSSYFKNFNLPFYSLHRLGIEQRLEGVAPAALIRLHHDEAAAQAPNEVTMSAVRSPSVRLPHLQPSAALPGVCVFSGAFHSWSLCAYIRFLLTYHLSFVGQGSQQLLVLADCIHTRTVALPELFKFAAKMYPTALAPPQPVFEVRLDSRRSLFDCFGLSTSTRLFACFGLSTVSS